MTLLHIAVVLRLADMVRLLIDSGAIIDAKNKVNTVLKRKDKSGTCSRME